MARKTAPEKTYKTVKFVVYCFEQSKPGKEEGTVTMTDRRHKLVKSLPERHFDSYCAIAEFVRQSMAERRARLDASTRL
jgi:hypothetical protein